ncbi:hypothetical protein FIBSPDRAFT_858073 [Athelia psychrophila]|uniref:Uncharacterized protein n=1 Tax=Athelia psychrophila TaxID=1759441 RepID=A0A166M235_9AGAM|nr:hypothetical protein FIBSPDRAFT_858073 [Fibularhizoctonia sp. CBS 109695]
MHPSNSKSALPQEGRRNANLLRPRTDARSLAVDGCVIGHDEEKFSKASPPSFLTSYKNPPLAPSNHNPTIANSSEHAYPPPPLALPHRFVGRRRPEEAGDDDDEVDEGEPVTPDMHMHSNFGWSAPSTIVHAYTTHNAQSPRRVHRISAHFQPPSMLGSRTVPGGRMAQHSH